MALKNLLILLQGEGLWRGAEEGQDARGQHLPRRHEERRLRRALPLRRGAQQGLLLKY